MIVYSSDYFGLLTLLNLNGSAAYRAFLPALFSTAMLVSYKFTWGDHEFGSEMDLTVHPYVITIYVMAFSLVLNFRLNYSYQRYWEAASHLFLMTSKWVDAATILASFHYQSDIYRPYRPRPFGKKEKKEGDGKTEEKKERQNGSNKNDQRIEEEDELEDEADTEVSQVRRRRTVSVDTSLWNTPAFSPPQQQASSATSAATPKRSGNPNSPVGSDAAAPASPHNEADLSSFLGRLFNWGGAELASPTGAGAPTGLAFPSASPPNSTASPFTAPAERPKYHRRVPSVDLPVGAELVKSFKPSAGKHWEKSAKTTRLSSMPRMHNHNTHYTERSTRNRSWDLDAWVAADGIPTPSKKRSHHRHSVHETSRRTSLPTKRLGGKRNNSDPEIMPEIMHPNGVASDRIYGLQSSGHSSHSSHSSARVRLKPRRSSAFITSLNPYKWMGSRVKSAQSLDEMGRLGSSGCNGSNLLSEATDDDADTSSSNTTSIEQCGLLPSLFLQEAAHLFSLMSAVAMASLRADLEGCASPLVEYVPGQPFPPVNPDEMKVKVWLSGDEAEGDEMLEEAAKDVRALNERVDGDEKAFQEPQGRPTVALPSAKNHKIWIRNNKFRNALYFLLGISRNPRQRTLYNASRPFAVMGGLSDNEVELLQKARGPEAQTALCSLWLKEFICREHLDGSTGRVAPPIVARVYQFLSDGFAQYNQCRKTAYTQFPFVHSQLTTFFLVISIFIFPFLFYTYINSFTVACVMNFATLACFDGMHEVAREMQDPFYQFPNDLPLNNYQVQFNETLISCLYDGFHPDAPGGSKKNEWKGD